MKFFSALSPPGAHAPTVTTKTGPAARPLLALFKGASAFRDVIARAIRTGGDTGQADSIQKEVRAGVADTPMRRVSTKSKHLAPIVQKVATHPESETKVSVAPSKSQALPREESAICAKETKVDVNFPAIPFVTVTAAHFVQKPDLQPTRDAHVNVANKSGERKIAPVAVQSSMSPIEAGKQIVADVAPQRDVVPRAVELRREESPAVRYVKGTEAAQRLQRAVQRADTVPNEGLRQSLKRELVENVTAQNTGTQRRDVEKGSNASAVGNVESKAKPVIGKAAVLSGGGASKTQNDHVRPIQEVAFPQRNGLVEQQALRSETPPVVMPMKAAVRPASAVLNVMEKIEKYWAAISTQMHESSEKTVSRTNMEFASANAEHAELAGNRSIERPKVSEIALIVGVNGASNKIETKENLREPARVSPDRIKVTESKGKVIETAPRAVRDVVQQFDLRPTESTAKGKKEMRQSGVAKEINRSESGQAVAVRDEKQAEQSPVDVRREIGKIELSKVVSSSPPPTVNGSEVRLAEPILKSESGELGSAPTVEHRGQATRVARAETGVDTPAREVANRRDDSTSALSEKVRNAFASRLKLWKYLPKLPDIVLPSVGEITRPKVVAAATKTEKEVRAGSADHPEPREYSVSTKWQEQPRAELGRKKVVETFSRNEHARSEEQKALSPVTPAKQNAVQAVVRDTISDVRNGAATLPIGSRVEPVENRSPIDLTGMEKDLPVKVANREISIQEVQAAPPTFVRAGDPFEQKTIANHEVAAKNPQQGERKPFQVSPLNAKKQVDMAPVTLKADEQKLAYHRQRTDASYRTESISARQQEAIVPVRAAALNLMDEIPAQAPQSHEVERRDNVARNEPTQSPANNNGATASHVTVAESGPVRDLTKITLPPSGSGLPAHEIAALKAMAARIIQQTKVDPGQIETVRFEMSYADPRDLQLVIRRVDERIEVEIVARKGETADVIESGRAALQSYMLESGLRLEKFEVRSGVFDFDDQHREKRSRERESDDRDQKFDQHDLEQASKSQLNDKAELSKLQTGSGRQGWIA